MALKRKLTSAEHQALSEAIRAVYRADGDSFILDAENEDLSGLRNALDSERSARATAERQLRETVDKFKDVDPQKARDAMSALQQLEDARDLDGLPDAVKAKVTAIVDRRTERLRADHTNQVNAWNTERDGFSKKLTATEGSLKQLTINSALQQLATKHGVKKDLVSAAISMFTNTGIDGITWDIRDGKVVALKDGNVKYGKTANESMSFDEGFELLASQAPSFFEPSNGGGAQPGAGGKVQGNALIITNEQAKNPQTYQAMKAQAEKAGQQLQIAG